jgi:hypothetical protein
MALIRTDVSEERIASIIRVEGISELETMMMESPESQFFLTRVTRRYISEGQYFQSQP